MTDRIRMIAHHYGLTSTAFADQVEIPRPVISHIFSARNRPSLEVIQKIGLAFPDVDLEWLLYGKGEMLRKIAKVPEVIGSKGIALETVEPQSIKEEPAFQPSKSEIIEKEKLLKIIPAKASRKS